MERLDDALGWWGIHNGAAHNLSHVAVIISQVNLKNTSAINGTDTLIMTIFSNINILDYCVLIGIGALARGSHPSKGGGSGRNGGNRSVPGRNRLIPGGNESDPGGNRPVPGRNRLMPGGNKSNTGGNRSIPGGTGLYLAGTGLYLARSDLNLAGTGICLLENTRKTELLWSKMLQIILCRQHVVAGSCLFQWREHMPGAGKCIWRERRLRRQRARSEKSQGK